MRDHRDRPAGFCQGDRTDFCFVYDEEPVCDESLTERARNLPERFSWIGYRAHEFLPVWGEKEENCIPAVIAGKSDMPFEKKYYLQVRSDDPERKQDDVRWFIQRDLWEELERRGDPDWLKIREEKRVLRNKTGMTAFALSACFLKES